MPNHTHASPEVAIDIVYARVMKDGPDVVYETAFNRWLAEDTLAAQALVAIATRLYGAEASVPRQRYLDAQMFDIATKQTMADIALWEKELGYSPPERNLS